MPVPSPTPEPNAWPEARNLLCVRLDCLGDVLMTTPALRALKEAHPGRRLTLLTSTGGAAAAGHLPAVDDVLAYDAPWMKASTPRLDRSADEALLKTLRDRRFDAAVIFTVFSQNPLPAATYCYLAGIPLRLAHCRENPYQLLTDWIRESEPEAGIRHEVQRQLDLVAACGAWTNNERLSFRVDASDRDFISDLLTQCRVSRQQPWLVLHPGASALSRRYPPEKFAKVIEFLTKEQGLQVILTGNDQERDLVAMISDLAAVPTTCLAGRLRLGQFAALLQAAPLLISNNSGPVHLAAAVGTPVVDLYALTNPQHTPWKVAHRVLSHDVPCRNCFKSVCPEKHQHCLSLIEPDQVVAAALELLAERQASTTTVAAEPLCFEPHRRIAACTP